MIRRILGIFSKRFLTDAEVRERYLRIGQRIGFAVSYMRDPVGFKKRVRTWERWEAEYARRGYRTISLDDFYRYGGWSIPLPSVDARREEGEEPRFHARIYRDRYLGKIEPVIDPFKGEIQVGFFQTPSTEDEEE